MKRLMLTFMAVMAVVVAAGPLPGDSGAVAKDGQRGGGRWEQRMDRGDRGDRGGGNRGYERPGRGYERPGRGNGGGEWRRVPRRDYGPPPSERYYGPPARRGGYMPPQYRDEGVVENYGRYRLRPPPRGYAWVRVGGGYALVSMGTGQVFDVVPD